RFRDFIDLVGKELRPCPVEERHSMKVMSLFWNDVNDWDDDGWHGA
ncbi:unnamed protein product, partial [marine sediment metagenome]